jgi:hypothetical protein
MSRFSDFWESMVSATLMLSKYADTPVIQWCIRTCEIACKITVSNTSGHRLSRQKNNDFCSEDLVFLKKIYIFRVKAAPQPCRVNSCQNAAYTCTKTVFKPNDLCKTAKNISGKWGVPGVLSSGVKHGWGMTLTTHPHLVPRSRMSRSYTFSSPPPQVPPWRVVGQLTFHHT